MTDWLNTSCGNPLVALFIQLCFAPLAADVLLCCREGHLIGTGLLMPWVSGLAVGSSLPSESMLRT